MSTLELTSKSRSALRGAAHPLKPVVMIGDQGLTAPVLKEIDLALNSHELIKVKAGSQEREDRNTILTQICEQLVCAAVHHLGKTFILYRPSDRRAYAEVLGEKIAKPVAILKRKASDPHTPKKLAAQGKILGKRSRIVKDTDRDTGNGRETRVFSAEKPTRPTRRAVGQTAKRATQAKPRSAMSLKSGARRGRTN
jgi:RNA-binding protein